MGAGDLGSILDDILLIITWQKLETKFKNKLGINWPILISLLNGLGNHHIFYEVETL